MHHNNHKTSLRFIENNIIKNIQKFTTPNLVIFMNFISHIVYTKLFLLLIIILYVFKFITTKHFILLCLVHPIVHALKVMIKRNRPYIDSDIKLLDDNIIDVYSFPSGHSAFIFLLYFILHDNGIITTPYIIIPLLVGFSRIILGAHYITDVIAGAILARILASL